VGIRCRDPPPSSALCAQARVSQCACLLDTLSGTYTNKLGGALPGARYAVWTIGAGVWPEEVQCDLPVRVNLMTAAVQVSGLSLAASVGNSQTR
jgi:hypothetical protein